MASESLNDYRRSNATDPNFEATESRRALHGFNLVEYGGASPHKKYVPFMKRSAEQQIKGKNENDGYKFFGINAILNAANHHYNFNEDIDDSEEDEISDDELRMAIKTRKNKEKARRDDLTTVKIAALQAVKSVEEVRN